MRLRVARPISRETPAPWDIGETVEQADRPIDPVDKSFVDSTMLEVELVNEAGWPGEFARHWGRA